MYIKKVNIQNLRSYRNFTAVGFDKGLNVIVGKNGAGKSNLLLAFRLVLCAEEFSTNDRERMVLLNNNGIGPNVTGYVELVFDNSDNRLPINALEVKIRHTLSAAGSRFAVNNRDVTKAHIIALFESVGISIRNPYFWVGQGAICKVINAASFKRMEMLQDIIGVTTHCEKVKLTEAILVQIQKLQDSIEIITEEFRDREEEIRLQTVELRQLEDLEDHMKAIEYTLCQRECNRAIQASVKVKERLDGVKKMFEKRLFECEKLKVDFKKTEKALLHWQHEENAAAIDLSVLCEQEAALTKAHAKLENDCNLLKADLNNQRAAKEAKAANIRQFKESGSQYNDQVTQSEEIKAKMRGIKNEMHLKELQSSELKRKKFATYESVDDRKEIIEGRLEHLKDCHKKVLEIESELISKVTDVNKECDKAERERNKDTDSLIKMNEEIEKIENECNRLHNKCDNDVSKIRSMQSKEYQLSIQLKNAEHELKTKEKMLLGYDYKTYNEIRELIKEFCYETHQIENENYSGMVIEIFTCEKEYYTAVDIIGSKKLLNHIVETDVFATQLAKAFNRKKIKGNLNMLALNRLNPKKVDFSEIPRKRGRPLIDFLKFESKYASVIEHCFGNAMICPTEDDCKAFAKEKHLNCITIEGVKYASRGAIYGGYHNKDKSMMMLQADRRSCLMTVAELKKDLKMVKESGAEAEKERVCHTKAYYEKDNEMKEVKDKNKELQASLQQNEKDLARIKQSQEFYGEKLQKARSEVSFIKEKIGILEKESRQDWIPQFTLQEENQLRKLTEEIAALKRSHAELFEQYQQNAKWIEKCKVLQKIRVREAETETNDEQTLTREINFLEENIRKLQHDLKQNKKQCREKEQDRQSAQKTVFTTSELFLKMKEEYEQAKIGLNDKDIEKQKCSTEMQKILRRVCYLNTCIADMDCVKIRLCEELEQLANNQLQETLAEFKTRRENFQAVNRNAINEYNHLRDKLEQLMNQYDELARDFQAVNTTKTNTIRNEDAAIDITYKQVRGHFSKIFSQLVSSGRGELVLRKDAPRHRSFGRPSVSTASESTASEDGLYTGIDFLVSFTGDTRQRREMQQLSGGQKCLTALAFIFAIQACDRMPFYLFDEIDAHLDDISRHKVADLLKEYAANIQIITTTFHPELVNRADLMFKVFFRQRSSKVETVSLQDAVAIFNSKLAQPMKSTVGSRND